MPRSRRPSTSMAISTSPTSPVIWRSSRAVTESIHCKSSVHMAEGADRIRTGVRGFAGLCLTSRPPRRRACHRTGRKVGLGRKRDSCAECTHAASCEPCPGVDGARCGWSPGPLPGLPYGYERKVNADYATPGASRRPARRRAVARVRRSARRPAAMSAASSPLRARRRRSRWRSRSYARWLSGFTLTGRARAA